MTCVNSDASAEIAVQTENVPLWFALPAPTPRRIQSRDDDTAPRYGRHLYSLLHLAGGAHLQPAICGGEDAALQLDSNWWWDDRGWPTYFDDSATKMPQRNFPGR
jgi:hypothetical protein